MLQIPKGENRNYCQFFINECYKNMGKYVFIDTSG